jgi:hypothetical protein
MPPCSAQPTSRTKWFESESCVPDSVMFKRSPAVSFGIYNVGTKHDVTDYNVLDLMFQDVFKEMPEHLRKQREQVSQYVLTLEKQLPSKSEMDALLSDINQAGVGRGLDFELFKPGQTNVKEYYAELPIAVRITGNYHDMGAFASDVAQLPRIVTLNDVAIANDKGVLTMDAVAKTFRYLDEEELAKQRALAKAKAKK